MYGTDIPEPIKSFEELQTQYNVNPRIMENLKSLKFLTPTVIEMQAIPVMMHVSYLLINWILFSVFADFSANANKFSS